MIPRDLTPAILEGEVREVLERLPDESIQCVVTSPPYWGLRDYGLPPVLWGGSPSCPHEWGSPIPGDPKGGTGTPNGRNVVGAGYARGERRGRFCLSCDAWLGQLGLEPTAELFVQHLAGVFDEVRRVLRSDGTLWLNLGDTFQGDSPVPTVVLRGVLGPLGPFPDSRSGRATAERRAEWRPQAQGPRGNPLAGHSRTPATRVVAPVGLRLGEAQSNARIGPGPTDPFPRVRLSADKVEPVLLRRRWRPSALSTGNPASTVPGDVRQPVRRAEGLR